MKLVQFKDSALEPSLKAFLVTGPPNLNVATTIVCGRKHVAREKRTTKLKGGANWETTDVNRCMGDICLRPVVLGS